MQITDILEEEKNTLLLESGVRIPKGSDSAMILHHDDFDGVMSAIAMGLQLKKQGVKKIDTKILHDGDDEETQIKKLSKKKGQLLVAVDFDRFRGKAGELAKKNLDVQTDHHEKNDPDEKNTDKKSVQTKYGSDVLHISSTKAIGFMSGSDLSIMTGIDSAKFKGNLLTNNSFNKKLQKNDGSSNRKMRLAIITNGLLNQLVRGSSAKGDDGAYKTTVSPNSVKNIISAVIKSPTITKLYSAVKQEISGQRELIKVLDAYEGKKIDFDKIKEYNASAKPNMRVAITKAGTVRKSEEQGRAAAGTEEELKTKAKEAVDKNYDVDEKGNKSIKPKDTEAFGKKWAAAEVTAEKKHEEQRKAIKAGTITAPKNYGSGAGLWWKAPWMPKGKKFGGKTLSAARRKELTTVALGDARKKNPSLSRKSQSVSFQDGGSERYLSYEDPKILEVFGSFGKQR
jgi:hypothetical protein